MKKNVYIPCMLFLISVFIYPPGRPVNNGSLFKESREVFLECAISYRHIAMNETRNHQLDTIANFRNGSSEK